MRRANPVSTARWLAPALAALACGPAPAPELPGVAAVDVPAAPPPSSEIAADPPDPAEPPQAATVATDDRPGQFTAPMRPSRQKRTAQTTAIALRTTLKPRWSAKVGKTTFRTTMAMVGDAIVIGTHGASLDGKDEKTDGVYVLEAKTGTTRKLIATPGKGDLDVGGVAIDGDRVYFTTDNGLVVAATLAGKVLWQATLRGKVRPAPALGDLTGDGTVDVVAGDEEGLLSALDGATGKAIWAMPTGRNEYDAQGFIGAAAITDVDGDGKDDVIAGARDGAMIAYRGRDGHPIWAMQGSSGIHASPLVLDADGDGRREVLAAWSYSNIMLLDARTGRERWSQWLELDSGGIEGLFGTPTPLPGGRHGGVLVAPTAWWDNNDGIIGVGPGERDFRSTEKRVTSSAVVTDLDNDGVLEAILGTETGKLLALHADGGRAELAVIKGGVEATPMLADVDKDGTYELLVAGNDGTLQCFATGSTARPLISRFRGESLHNRGELGGVKLGWTLLPMQGKR